MNVYIPTGLEHKVDEYRKARKEETGKMMLRTTAVCELLELALADLKPTLPISDRVSALERQVSVLTTLVGVEQ